MNIEAVAATKRYSPKEPEPLVKRSPSEPYPIDQLGDVLGPAAKAIAAKVQCAEALAAQSVLGVASLAAQALADVQLPYGQTRPLSLFLLSVAASGDRKSSADNEAMAPVRRREEELRDEFEPLAKSHAAEAAAWRGQRNQIDRGKKDLATRRDEMLALGPEPPAPIRPYLTLSESTAEGLARHMPQLPGALGIFTAEGGQFLSGHGFTPDSKLRTASSFANLWDGEGFRRLRAGEGLIDLHGRRLAAHLMVQPEAAARVLADPVLRDQGFLSRFLIAAPDSLAGTRLWQEPHERIEPALLRYNARMLTVFQIKAPSANGLGNELTPRELELTADGRAAWIGFLNEVELDQRADGRWVALRDVASKAAEQAARIAGVLTIVDNHAATAITGGAMTRACDLVRWYLNEALRLSEEIRIPQDIADAQLLLDWFGVRSMRYVAAVDIQKRGPAQLRHKERLAPAIEVLVEKGWLVPDKTSRRVWTILSKPQEPH
jgi:hypothetical protein